MNTLKPLIQDHQNRIIQIRRDLHQIPETAFTEEKTSAYLLKQLQAMDLEIESNIASHGIVALLKTHRPGPTVLFRADMDALPISEDTGLAFASKNPGVMHACGHDAHMAMVLGTAIILDNLRARLCGNIKFLFQPAEEGPGGAKPMIESGVMQNPHVDYVFGCHVWPDIPQGTVGVIAGPFMAAMDRFDIRITGKGGHGAMPHECVDALEIGTQVVNALQRIVSRQTDPLKPTVVTVGTFKAGTAFNIIPDVAELSGTTRTFDMQTWEQWEETLSRIVGGVCQSMGADFELDFKKGYPVTINDNDMSELVRKCARHVVDAENVVTPARTMGGEDFAFFLQKAKGCFFALGAGREGGISVHNARFDFDEAVMATGVEVFCRIALEILKKQ
jgi:amidohydrolase